MFEKILKNELFEDIKKVVYFMKKSGVRMKFFISSIVLSLALTLFSIYTVSLLFPLVEGIIKGNFNHVKNIKIIGTLVSSYPNIFFTSLRLFLLLVFWIYLTIIIKSILQYFSALSTQYQARVATVKLREILIDKCLRFNKSFYDQNKIIYIHEVLTKSTNTISAQFKILQDFIVQVFLLVTYLFIMFYISWKLALVCMIIFPVSSFFTKQIVKKIRDILKNTEILTANLNNTIMNILYCMPVVRGFNQEERERKIFSEISNEEISQSFKRQKLSNLLGPIEDMGATTSILFLALGMALIIYLDKSFDPSRAIIFFYLAQKIIPGLNSFNNFKLGMVNANRAVENINHIIEGSDNFILKDGNIDLKELKDGIEIKNLSFGYDDATGLVLKNVSFKIPKGKITAIVGPTGSGKSTITNLLLRFYDCPAGSIFIDSVDIHDYKIDSLRKKISFVNQDVLLFNSTIEHNIKYGIKDNISNDLIMDITQKTSVHDFVEKLPKSYQTEIGERGSNFSGGEKQRISIARALIKDHDIFIMDEATSALDGNTERKIVEGIKDLLKNKTQIIISHRLSTIKNADQIVYLKEGEVKEVGSLQELIDLKGEFYKQWESQKI